MDNRNSIEDFINKALKNILDCPQEHFPNDLNLFTLGLDSVAYIKLLVAIEDKFEFEFDDEDLNLAELITIETLIKKIIIHIEAKDTRPTSIV